MGKKARGHLAKEDKHESHKPVDMADGRAGQGSAIGEVSSDIETGQTMAIASTAHVAGSELEGHHQTASAAQKALGLFEIIAKIVDHIMDECHCYPADATRRHPPGDCEVMDNPRPQLLGLMHVSRTWRAAAQPFLMRTVSIYGYSGTREYECMAWGRGMIHLEPLLRDGGHLFKSTTTFDYLADIFTQKTDPEYADLSFKALALCSNLRTLDLGERPVRTWSKLPNWAPVSLPCLESLSLHSIATLPLVPLDPTSISRLKHFSLRFPNHYTSRKDDSHLGIASPIDWLKLLFAASSRTLENVALIIQAEDRSGYGFAAVYSATRPYIEHVTDLTLASRSFPANTMVELPRTLKRFKLEAKVLDIQFVVNLLRDPTYLPNLVSPPSLCRGFGERRQPEPEPFPRALIEQAIQGLKARKGMKWKNGDNFMGIPMDFDEQDGQGDIQ